MIDNKTYLLNYTISYIDGTSETKKAKIKNSLTDLHAKIKLGEILKAKHPNFKSLVIHTCEIWLPMPDDETLKNLKDLLGMTDNPFF